MKKLTALLLALVMLLSLTACGAKVDAPATEAATAPAPAPDEATAAPAANNGLDPNEKVTLHLYGTANFIDVGAEGTIDLVSGVEMPGYNELIAAWNEKYPNVEVVVETCPWDNWITSIQTAVLSGGVDIILHGATLTELCEPLDPYLQRDSEYADKLFATENRRFGPEETAAVRLAQQRAGLLVTGTVDRGTWAALQAQSCPHCSKEE